MSLGEPKPTGSRGVLSEINVTPFVDVMLVLLIIFMVCAPLMQQGIKVDLPKASTGAIDESEDPILLAAAANRVITLNGKSVAKGTLRTRLEGMAKARPEVQVMVQADQSLPYGFVAQVMAEIKAAKITRVSLVTLPGKPKSEL